MMNIRDLIYGQSAATQLENEAEQMPTTQELYGRRIPIIHFTGYAPEPPKFKRRKLVPEYWSAPPVAYKHKCPQFVPGSFGYQMFEQLDESTDIVKARAVRELWDHACDGGDLESAVKIMKVLAKVDSVEFFDFHRFILMLANHSDVTLAEIGSIANIAIASKRHPSKRVDSARALLHMFLELLVVRDFNTSSNHATCDASSPQLSAREHITEEHPGITRAIDLFNKHSSNPVVTLDPSVYAMAATLHTLRTVTLSLTLDVSVVICKGQSVAFKEHRDVTSSVYMPTVGDVARNPLLLYTTLTNLRTYDRNFALYSRNQTGFSDRRSDVHRAVRELGEFLKNAFMMTQNKDLSYIHVLYAAHLESNRKSNEARRVMLYMLRHTPTDRGKRLFVHYVVRFVPVDHRKDLLVQAVRFWLVGNSISQIMALVGSMDAEIGDDYDNESASRTNISVPFVSSQLLNTQYSLSTVGSSAHQSSLTFPSSNLSVDDNVGDPHMSCPPVAHTKDGLVAAMLLYSYGELSQAELLPILCDAIEAFPPRASRKRYFVGHNEGSEINLEGLNLGEPSGYTELHLCLWRSVANMLGPLTADPVGSGNVLHISESSATRKYMSHLEIAKNLHNRHMESLCGVDNMEYGVPIVPGVFGENMLNVASALKHYVPKQQKPFTYIPVLGTDSYQGQIDINIEGNDDDDTAEREDDDKDDAVDGGDDDDIVGKSCDEDSSTTTARTVTSQKVSCVDDGNCSSTAGLLDAMLRKRKWWVASGCIFTVQNLGDELSWNVLECSAEAACASAVRQYPPPMTAEREDKNNRYSRMYGIGSDEIDIDLIGDIERNKSVAKKDITATAAIATTRNFHDDATLRFRNGDDDNDDDDDDNDDADDVDGGGNVSCGNDGGGSGDVSEGEYISSGGDDHWDSLMGWCDCGDCPDLYYSSYRSTMSGANADKYKSSFVVRKLHVELERTSIHWKNWPTTKTRKESLVRHRGIALLEKTVAFALGNGLLELLTYQIIVHCHLSQDKDSLFVAKAIQILVQHATWQALDFCLDGRSENCRDVALRCIAYLTHMGFDVPRAVRVGNILRGRHVDCRVAPAEVVPLPLDEHVLHTSRRALEYDGI